MTIDDWRARYDGLNAEVDRLRAENAELRKWLDASRFLVDALRAQVRPEAIGEKHRDGNWWMLWEPEYEQWFKLRWRYERWQLPNGSFLGTPTHALPLPPAPEGL